RAIRRLDGDVEALCLVVALVERQQKWRRAPVNFIIERESDTRFRRHGTRHQQHGGKQRHPGPSPGVVSAHHLSSSSKASRPRRLCSIREQRTRRCKGQYVSANRSTICCVITNAHRSLSHRSANLKSEKIVHLR